MNKEFWTIMIGDNFLNNNLFRGDNDSICEAVRFSDEESCREYFMDLRKDKPFKIVKVSCKLETFNE